MFQNCNELEYIDLSSFNTSKLTDISYMFNECLKLKEIKGINNFITINVIYMNSMYQCCKELVNLDLCNFNTSKVTDMSFMFNGCLKLKEIKGINNFNTINVTTMRAMFQNCNELEYLNLTNFKLLKLLICLICLINVIN